MPINIENKPIEIFCGTGGVGKTTLATSRALFLALQGKKILLITIDPAIRLKEILGLSNDDAGTIKKISTRVFHKNNGLNSSFDALLMSPAATLNRVGEISNTVQEFTNPILKILTKPYGGTNEIMSIIEVQQNLALGKYDTIVLDTPPGKHFIDFLQASQRIQHFFDKTFVEIFRYLGKSVYDSKFSRYGTEILNKLVASGIKRLLRYLERVTGSDFVDQFIGAIVALYKNRESFLEALVFQRDLQDVSYSNWFLVTSVEHQKFTEAYQLQNEAEPFMHKDNFLAINKCLSPYLNDWKLPLQSGPLYQVRSSMLKKEKDLKSFANKKYSKVLEFGEVLSQSPAEHVQQLSTSWDNWQG